MDPVRAEQEAVARQPIDRDDVDPDAVLGTQRPGDDVTTRIPWRRVRVQAALADERGDEAVILGQLLQPAATRPVGTAVADVRDA